MNQYALTTRIFPWAREWFWVIAFILFCIISLEQALKGQKNEYRDLQVMRVTLETKILEETSRQENLIQEINSQSDPAWVELTLMKRLGLIPEGYKKVVFIPKKE